MEEREKRRKRHLIFNRDTLSATETTFADNLNDGPSYKASEEAGSPNIMCRRSLRRKKKTKVPTDKQKTKVPTDKRTTKLPPDRQRKSCLQTNVLNTLGA